MKAFVLGLLLTINGILYSQSYTLPSILFDSLTFEVIKGRQCEQDQKVYLADLLRGDSLMMAHGKLIELQASVIEDQNRIIYDFPKEIKANHEICIEEKKKLKTKLKRVWKIVILEGGIIACLLLL